MIRPTQNIIAMVPLFSPSNALGLPAAWDEPFAGTTVLGCMLARLSRCRRLNRIVLLHASGQAPPILPLDAHLRPRVVTLPIEGSLLDANHVVRIAARRWSPTSWRGGLGGATCYDENLAAAAFAHAAQKLDASAVLMIGADWPLVDPALCDAVIERHLEQPDRLKLVFTQAPAGLAGCLVERSLLNDLAAKGATIGSILDYQPQRPQGDPIGKDPCVQIPPGIRNASIRATFDVPRWQQALRWLEGQCVDHTPRLMDFDAAAIVPLLAHAMEITDRWPQQVTVELTTARLAEGPIVPQSAAADDLSRPPMPLAEAHQLFKQLGAAGDVAITFGGLGDPLLHPDWSDFIHSAHGNHIAAIHVQTDLQVDQATLQRLLEAPVDVVSVNLSADTPGTYRKLMGSDAFEGVLANIEWLLNARRTSDRGARRGLPWIVPRFVKTADNVDELEAFVDRWTMLCGHAIVESPMCPPGIASGRDLAVINMAPPRRLPCRQLKHRLSVLSNGTVALCDQDWKGGCGVGHVTNTDVATAWRRIGEIRERQTAGRFDATVLCKSCREWHRP